MSEPANQPSPGISRTSIYVAAGRAVGAREPDPSARNPDYLAEKLLGDPSKLDLDHPAVRALSLGYDEAMKDVEVVSIVRMMTVRTRFIDEALERAIAGGATQVVILGAGFDSHAYRCQELLAHVRVFEVDRPATQALKKQRVNDVLGGPPANLTYVAIDFQHEDLPDVLTRHGYDPAQRTFFILEGVTMYLPEEAVRGTLRFVAAHPPGSGIVFDFVYRAMIDMLARIDMANVPEAAKPFVATLPESDQGRAVGVWSSGGRRARVSGRIRSRAPRGVDDRRRGIPQAISDQGRRHAGRRPGDRGSDGSHGGTRASGGATAPQGQQMPPERMREQQRLMAYQLAEAVVARRDEGSPHPKTSVVG